MTLFNFGKKKTAPLFPCPESILILGAGCKTCHRQYENAKEAVSNLGLSITVDYITDLEKVMQYGVMAFPAIVVDGKVTASGKLLSVRDMEWLLHNSF